MKFKHFFYIFLGILSIYITIYWITLNYNLLVKEPFRFTKTISVPTWLAIFLFFLAGFFFMGILFLIDAWKKTRKINKLLSDKEKKISFGEAVEISVFNLLQGETEEAKKILDSIEPGVQTDESKILKLYIFLREKNLEEAEKLFKETETFENLPIYILLKAKFLELKEDFIGALSVLKEREDLFSPSLERLYLKNLRNLYIKLKNFEEALQIQDKILKNSPKEEEKKLRICLLYELAKSLKKDGKEKEAIHKIQDILKEEPKFTPAWVLFGDIYKEENEMEKAISVYTEGFKNTYSAILIHRIENLYLENEEAAKALEAINHLRFQVEKDTIPRFFLGRLYLRLEMIEEAYKFLSSLQPFAPNSVVLNFLLGTLEERFGKKEKALASYKKCLKSYDALANEYYCFSCGKSFKEWQDRCPNCGAWASIEINFKEEITEDTLGVKVNPISFPLF